MTEGKKIKLIYDLRPPVSLPMSLRPESAVFIAG